MYHNAMPLALLILAWVAVAQGEEILLLRNPVTPKVRQPVEVDLDDELEDEAEVEDDGLVDGENLPRQAVQLAEFAFPEQLIDVMQANAVWAEVEAEGMEADGEGVEAEEEEVEILMGQGAHLNVQQSVVAQFKNQLQVLALRLNLIPVDKNQLRPVQDSLRPAMVAELDRVRQLCDLTPDQRPRIRRAAETGLRLAARKFVRMCELEERGIAVDGMTQADCHPRHVIQERLQRVLKQVLTADQKRRYEEELGQSIQDRRVAFAMEFVSQMDGVLRLTSDQRDVIAKSLMATFNDDWLQLMQFGDQLNGGVLDIVDESVMKRNLSASQRRVWKGLQKYSPNIWIDNDIQAEGSFQGSTDPDEDWWAGRIR